MIVINGHLKKKQMKFEFYSQSVKVIDSYKASKSDIKRLIPLIKNNIKCPDIIKNRTDNSLYREWRAHNILYKLGLFKERTKDVDLDRERWYTQIIYFIIGIF